MLSSTAFARTSRPAVSLGDSASREGRGQEGTRGFAEVALRVSTNSHLRRPRDLAPRDHYPLRLPHLLVSVATLDRRLEWSSDVLGAAPTQNFLRVIAPQLKTGLIASLIFTFILSFNNVTLALFLSGFGERTLPVEMFQRMNVGGMTPVIPAISFVLALIGVVLFVALDRTMGVYRFLAGRD